MPVSLPRPEIRPLRADEWPRYRAFAVDAWGMYSHQASPAHLDWLAQNPNRAENQSDLVVAALGENIVGACHRIRLRWSRAGERTLGTSLHDLYLLPEARLGRTAMNMVASLIRDQPLVLLAGSTQRAERLYRLVYAPRDIPSFWQYKVFHPLLGAYRRGLHRLMPNAYKEMPAFTEGEGRTAGFTTQWTGHPAASELEEALTLPSASDLNVDWDLPTFQWRFFHEEGPANILLTARQPSGRMVGRAVLSRGRKDGLPVCRLVDFTAEENCAAPLLEAIDSLIPRTGAAVAFSVTTCARAAASLTRLGWKKRAKTPGFSVLSTPESAAWNQPEIWGGAWDFGVER